MALLSELLVLFVSSILLFLFLGLLFLPLIIVIIARVVEERQNRETYEKSQYYKSTQLPYDYAMNDTGTYGEYCTYQILERCALPNTKFLFNVYVPTGINTTTEIDIIMLSPAGIIVVDNLVFIAKRINKGQMANRWEFPGGKVEEGETQQQTLIKLVQTFY